MPTQNIRHLELVILLIKNEIEIRQLEFLKRILDGDNDHPVKMSYHEMLRYQAEKNWTNNVHELCLSTIFP